MTAPQQIPLPTPRVLEIGEGRRVVIRPAVPADAKGWIAVLEEVAREGRYIAVENVTVTRRDLARHFRTGSWGPEGASILAAEESAVVGQLTIWRDRGIHSHLAELGMSILAPYRGLGVARELMDGAFDWAQDFGVEKVNLNVLPHNERAIRFYEKMGFVIEGRRAKHARMSYGYEDFIEMSKFV